MKRSANDAKGNTRKSAQAKHTIRKDGPLKPTTSKATSNRLQQLAGATSVEDHENESVPAMPQSANGPTFPIVGVGASAGGLDAFTKLLHHLPADTGLGFVLVQHLDPQHESALSRILSRATSMPVREATHNMKVEPNHVYIIPPNASLEIAQGVLKLQPRREMSSPHRSIDFFLESLAQDRRERAIGVILSGTATDGTLGLEAIKAEGGITFAQDDSAKYDSMPRSAVAAGCVDFVLTPEDIANELTRIARHPFVASQLAEPCTAEAEQQPAAPGSETPLPARGQPRKSRQPIPRAPSDNEHGFKKILLLLRNHSGVDFSLYKSTTIQRRVTRRMVLSKHDNLDEYASFLRGNAKEVDALYTDALISVTSFFRNAEAFDFLQRNVFPKLLQQRGDDPLRVWVLGCSTGQEAYSIAMAFVESAEKASRTRKLQVFATDLNDALLDKARHGLYSKTLAQDISPERLRRFFVEEEGGYRVIKPLRETVVFARQNLISDPPFSRMDLISCRNLLIYLESDLQQKAIPTFHYALKPGGFLFLGASESIGRFANLFEPADKKHKIYAKKAASTVPLHLPIKKDRGSQAPPGLRPPLPLGKKLIEPAEGSRGELNAQREADRVMVNQFAPPGVLINADLQILQFRGPTRAYLEPPTGKATFDVLKMACEGLMLPLRAAINKAKKENTSVRRENVPLSANGKSRKVTIQVIPLKNLRERCFLVLFEDAERRVLQKETKETKKSGKEIPSLSSLASVRTSAVAARRLASLERELAETRDYLQSTEEQYEAANEELQASNEEAQSANEELQSVNEELETSKEELESSNEELTTVNEEMAHRNAELSQLNADLANVQNSTKLPIVLLGRDLTLRRFSPAAAKIFNLLSTDLGRPLSGIRHNLFIPPPSPPMLHPPIRQSLSLEDHAREVIDTLREQDREVQDNDGRWYSLRLRPYMTHDNKVDGAVLVLVDITELKRTQHEVTAARDYAEATIRTARDALVVLRADLRVNTANEAFYKTFKVTPAETEGRLIYDLGNQQWEIPKLRLLLEEILPRNSFFNDFEVTHDFPNIGRRTMVLNARRLDQPESASPLILLAIEDITEQQRAETTIARLAAIVQSSDDAIISKDLNGVITSWNRGAEQLFGYTAQEAVGQSITMLIPPDRQQEEPEILDRLRRGQSVDHFETIRVRKDGSPVEISLTISPIKDASGQVIGASKIARDITEHKAAEEALRQAHAELQAHAEELRRFNDVAVGRELRMIELKKEINELCERQGAPPRYALEPQGDG